ncbi:MAG: flagellar export chaperone FliS [Candidatus Scalindua sp. AMX11]|nr:MAG: flagellar export chaperone FliS [Candidatus Scalindua sp.]NOG85877.1 flagellar export chaperone FliS [Planctomycetota bacterium]RZV96951.1 MAG: flagellar export chaperone FliS [Candidatus Scalindua sp. SCAELEC01]TDE66437.1 MAG: flagellar export chaperone FliS [Candidatus Scalindua sp. AMX11]GJQ60188.1 MAG: flagellar protein FliS [Candidatus Scalindua sp.]
MNTHKIELYKKTQLETEDQVALILKLYDRAIYHLEKGKSEIGEKRYEEKNVSLTKAKEIVLELLLSLDEEKGGAVAISLSQLYNFVIREILEANANLNCKAIDNSVKILSELRESWNSINSIPETMVGQDGDAMIAFNVSG